MCGIVGLYLKKKSLHSRLGAYLSEMLINMSSRGPDSAGFAIYNNSKPDQLLPVKDMKKSIVMGLIVLAALSLNELVKYLIQQQTKFSEENNYFYYLGYAGVATLLIFVMNKLLN